MIVGAVIGSLGGVILIMVTILVARSRRFKSSASAKTKTAAVKADQKQDGALESDV